MSKPKSTKKTKSKSQERQQKIQAERPKSAVVTMLLDESGSMASVWNSTIVGFNEYVSALKEGMKGMDVHFSALKFDSPRGVVMLQVGAALKDAITLGTHNYRPTGGTPLLDAVARTIQATDEVAGKNKADKIVVVIQTDGAENGSTQFSLAQVKQMIEERQGKGWEFVFIGAGINAFEAGVNLGFQAQNTMSYAKDDVGTRAIFVATANNTANYAAGAAVSMNYTGLQSSIAGEDANITRAKMAHQQKTAKATTP